MSRARSLLILAALAAAFAAADHGRSLPVDHAALNVLRPDAGDGACAPCGAVCAAPADDAAPAEDL
ncbi:MAG: hypothetical protein ISN26_02515 [Betaproteobacteria bacterium AqS2]|uniref:Uncharacterized protein n=1 Tax=Candidatus Amphirhobacter heronislandensis TaxID=1732024 RepID=A0A930UCB8_9GAMM|nr:hypothetical protein [Betaproteobacteria bacterium AqS2]